MNVCPLSAYALNSATVNAPSGCVDGQQTFVYSVNYAQPCSDRFHVNQTQWKTDCDCPQDADRLLTLQTPCLQAGTSRDLLTGLDPLSSLNCSRHRRLLPARREQCTAADDGVDRLLVISQWQPMSFIRTGCIRRSCFTHLPPTENMNPIQVYRRNQSACDVETSSSSTTTSDRDCRGWQWLGRRAVPSLIPDRIAFMELNVSTKTDASRPVVAFTFRTMGGSLFEGLRFTIDDEERMPLVQEASPTVSFLAALKPGGTTHRLRWEYWKDGQTPSGEISVALETLVLSGAFLTEAPLFNGTFVAQRDHYVPSKAIPPSGEVAPPTRVVTYTPWSALLAIITSALVAMMLLWLWSHKTRLKLMFQHYVMPFLPASLVRFSLGRNRYRQVQRDDLLELEAVTGFDA